MRGTNFDGSLFPKRVRWHPIFFVDLPFSYDKLPYVKISSNRYNFYKSSKWLGNVLKRKLKRSSGTHYPGDINRVNKTPDSETTGLIKPRGQPELNWYQNDTTNYMQSQSNTNLKLSHSPVKSSSVAINVGYINSPLPQLSNWTAFTEVRAIKTHFK